MKSYWNYSWDAVITDKKMYFMTLMTNLFYHHEYSSKVQRYYPWPKFIGDNEDPKAVIKWRTWMKRIDDGSNRDSCPWDDEYDTDESTEIDSSRPGNYYYEFLIMIWVLRVVLSLVARWGIESHYTKIKWFLTLKLAQYVKLFNIIGT